VDDAERPVTLSHPLYTGCGKGYIHNPGREMTFIYAVVIGAALGLAIGAVAERVPVSPILQSVAAAFAAAVVSVVAATVVVNVRSQAGTGGVAVAAVGISVFVLLAFVALVAVLAAAGHAVLGQFSGAAPALANHRPVVLGSVAGICAALPIVWIFMNALRSA
jgi:hypothetical protein